MSAKKNIETKIFEDETTDSGFISGTVSELVSVSEELDPREEAVDPREEAVDSGKVLSESAELDSGVIECSELLSSVDFSEHTPTQRPLIVIEDHKTPDTSPLPPLDLLFQQDTDGDTQLHIAAVHGCQKSVGTLIRVCPDKAWLDVPNDYGHTALHLAAMSGHAVVARMLVKAGASPNIRDVQGETPLHKAVAIKSLECIQALLAQVPEQPTRRLSTLLNQKNYKGQSCVHLAAAAGCVEALQTLVYFGADINATENLAGCTALHIAARNADVRVAHYLLTRCAGVDRRARNYAGRTPRRLAANNTAAHLFNNIDHSDDESDDDDTCPCASDSDSESLFERLSHPPNAIVA